MGFRITKVRVQSVHESSAVVYDLNATVTVPNGELGITFHCSQNPFLWVLRDLIKAYEAQRGEPRWCGVPGPHLREVWHLAQEQ